MGQLHAAVFVDVDIAEELSLQLSDLLFGVGTALLPHTGLYWGEKNPLLIRFSYMWPEAESD